MTGHVSRAGAPGNGGSSSGSGGLKEADEAPRVKLERGDDASELPTADIKTEMDGLIDSEGMTRFSFFISKLFNF